MKAKSIEQRSRASHKMSSATLPWRSSPRLKVDAVSRLGAGKTTLMRILVGELPVDGDSGEVWIHHNLRLAYVAQHSMHHLESCLEASPAAYIQRRFADGIDKELANLDMMKLSEDEEKERQKKGNIYSIVDRKMKGKTIEYGCVMDMGQPDKIKYIPENNLKAKEAYVMKLKRNHDEEWKARTSGMDQRPTTLTEVPLPPPPLPTAMPLPPPPLLLLLLLPSVWSMNAKQNHSIPSGVKPDCGELLFGAKTRRTHNNGSSRDCFNTRRSSP